MNNFGSASLGFLVGVVVAFSAAKLTESAVVQDLPSFKRLVWPNVMTVGLVGHRNVPCWVL